MMFLEVVGIRVKAKKSLGQNFLIDNNVITRISDNIFCSEDDLIVEIGPGMGALTRELIKKGCQVLCFEIDTDMKLYLDKLSCDNLNVIYKDILKVNLEEELKNYKYNKLHVVGNLPYYITTAIIKHLINAKIEIEDMVFMVQEEVADRFTSKPNSKDYGSITLYLNYYYSLEKLFKVSKHSFDPVPKVESAIIKLYNRVDKLDVLEDKYFKLIDDAFKMKRKTLKNNLSNYDFDKVLEVLNKYGFDERCRAEELPEEIFANISRVI